MGDEEKRRDDAAIEAHGALLPQNLPERICDDARETTTTRWRESPPPPGTRHPILVRATVPILEPHSQHARNMPRYGWTASAEAAEPAEACGPTELVVDAGAWARFAASSWSCRRVFTSQNGFVRKTVRLPASHAARVCSHHESAADGRSPRSRVFDAS